MGIWRWISNSCWYRDHGRGNPCGRPAITATLAVAVMAYRCDATRTFVILTVPRYVGPTNAHEGHLLGRATARVAPTHSANY